MVEGEEWEAVQREQTQALALAGTSGQPLAFICNVQEEMKKSANELSLDNVGGIFVVLLAGMGIACSIAVLGATQSQHCTSLQRSLISLPRPQIFIQQTSLLLACII